MTRGTLTDTYVAALQHGLVDLPPDVTRLGVVRHPTGWFHAAVDENQPDLGPPTDVLEDVRTAAENMKRQGLCEDGAHNAAWKQVGFESAYREYLETAADAQAALSELADRLAAGESIALVCYENTETKRCHRTVLKSMLEDESG